MTDTAPQALAEIAKGLSEAERKVIMEMGDGEHVFPASVTARDAGVPVAETRKIMRYFRDQGLARYGPLWSEDECRPAGSGTWLTRAGLALRSYLMSNSEGKE